MEEPCQHQSIRVFHFEDDTSAVHQYRKAFKNRGIVYQSFKRLPKDLVAFIRQEKPDFIIMDINIGHVDTYPATKLLREHPETSHIPILGLSDVEHAVGVRWAVNLIIDGYWYHGDHSPQELVQKVLSILHPQAPVAISSWARLKKFFAGKRRIILFTAVALFILLGPLFLGVYYLLPDTTKQYEKRLLALPHVQVRSVTFIWEYKHASYTLTKNFYGEIDEYYAHHPEKHFTDDMSLEDYYSIFLEHPATDGDTTIHDIAVSIQELASAQDFSSDETAEFALSFVQSIPFDNEKRNTMLQSSDYFEHQSDPLVQPNLQESLPRFPYETLYDQRGICTDKTFLAIALLRELGYGVALIDFQRHVAVGIQCPREFSTFQSGYCYTEVTAPDFYIGEIPASVQQIGSAIKMNEYELSKELWNVDSTALLEEDVHIYNSSKGNAYQLIAKRAPLLDEIRLIEVEFDSLTKRIDELRFEIDQSAYEAALIDYSRLIIRYTELMEKLESV
ncbi:MAG: hypothetical protein PHY34_04645 [Patescibacteria group bacterium]|nr:hypothetical protein [Patescibacteria group bacterium]